MKITILGAGNMGCANAADLTLKGHEVTLVKTSHSMHNETFNYVCAHNNEITLWQEGEEQTARIHAVTTDLSSVATADLVYITTQTNVHEQLIQRIAPLLRKGQVVLITPGYFSTAYFLRHCPDKDLTIIEGESSTIDRLRAGGLPQRPQPRGCVPRGEPAQGQGHAGVHAVPLCLPVLRGGGRPA